MEKKGDGEEARNMSDKAHDSEHFCPCGWSRDDDPWAIGGPIQPREDYRYAPGTDLWRIMHIFTAAQGGLPDGERRQAAEQLVDDLFPQPMHKARFAEARRRGVEVEAIREAAITGLLEGLWIEKRERSSVDYRALVDRLRSYLNDRVTMMVLGPAWRTQTETRPDRSREELTDPEALDERGNLRRWHDRDRSPSVLLDALDRELDDEEAQLLRRLRDTGGNVSSAARDLDWTRWRARRVLEQIQQKADAVA